MRYEQVEEQWLVLPAITLAFILSHIINKEGHNCFTSRREKDIYRCGEQEESPLGGACVVKSGSVLKGFDCGVCGGYNHATVQSHCLSGWTPGGGYGGGGSCGSSCGGDNHATVQSHCLSGWTHGGACGGDGGCGGGGECGSGCGGECGGKS